MKLQNFAENDWFTATDDGKPLTSAVDGKTVANITSSGLDFAAMLAHARNTGGTNLRQYTFHERANMLKALAKQLMEHKKEFYDLSTETGATKNDTWIKRHALGPGSPSDFDISGNPLKRLSVLPPPR